MTTNDRFLFLDRDGVINKRLPADYVKTWSEFEFLPFVLSALKLLRPHFKHTFVITNQAGVGKGLMNENDLRLILKKMRRVIRKHHGHIESVYYCTKLPSETPNCRKPESWMGLQAKKEYPAINFTRSIMIGDSQSDIDFGKGLGMITVAIRNPEVEFKGADFVCNNLKEFYSIFATQFLKRR